MQFRALTFQEQMLNKRRRRLRRSWGEGSIRTNFVIAMGL
jgi:hypothetical protein